MSIKKIPDNKKKIVRTPNIATMLGLSLAGKLPVCGSTWDMLKDILNDEQFSMVCKEFAHQKFRYPTQECCFEFPTISIQRIDGEEVAKIEVPTEEQPKKVGEMTVQVDVLNNDIAQQLVMIATFARVFTRNFIKDIEAGKTNITGLMYEQAKDLCDAVDLIGDVIDGEGKETQKPKLHGKTKEDFMAFMKNGFKRK